MPKKKDIRKAPKAAKAAPKKQRSPAQKAALEKMLAARQASLAAKAAPKKSPTMKKTTKKSAERAPATRAPATPEQKAQRAAAYQRMLAKMREDARTGKFIVSRFVPDRKRVDASFFAA